VLTNLFAISPVYCMGIFVPECGTRICETKQSIQRHWLPENGQCFRLYEDPTYSSQWGFLFHHTLPI